MNRRDFLRMLGAGAAAAAVPRWAAGAEKRDDRPNFVVLFTDDQGYADLGCFGAKDIRTPNIDRLAAEGMKFTSFYTAPVCTPSRAALMTGCYPRRVGLPGVLGPRAPVGINDAELTIAEVCKQRGYATMCVGKWHLGHRKPFLPTRHGFDAYFGIPYSNDMGKHPYPQRNYPPLPLMRDEKVIELEPDQSQLTPRYTAEAVKFIKANKDRPFFLYLPHSFPHVPWFASKRFKGKSRRGLYGDVIEEIDWSTGEILKLLDELGLAGNTLVIYTSDNGGASHRKGGARNEPLRGGKGSTWEGGMRDPCVMRWPRKIPAATTCDEITSNMDLLPTFAAILDVKLPAGRTLDGHNILPLMTGEKGAKSPYEALFYHRGTQLQAVRSGKWKLHLARTQRRRRRKGEAPREPRKLPARLYDLQADIGEENDIADKHPDVVDRLTALAKAHLADLKAHSRPPGRVQAETKRKSG